MRPDVSVLIPTFNRADLIAETLQCVREQSAPAREIIVVDDGSTDNTEEVVRQFGADVTYHRIPNSGVATARNVAARYATSRFLAFCDSDDLWRPDKLAMQMDLHAQHPLLEYSFTNFQILEGNVESTATKLDEAPANFFTSEVPADGSSFVHPQPLYRQLLTFQPIWPSTIVVSRARFDRLGGFRDDLGRNHSEDFEFSLRCVAEGPIGIVRKPVVQIRKHQNNVSADVRRQIQDEISILHVALKHHDLADPLLRSEVERAISLRKIELVYGSFRSAEFGEVRSLLKNVPSSLLDNKTRLKLGIACLPRPLANALQHFMLRA